MGTVEAHVVMGSDTLLVGACTLCGCRSIRPHFVAVNLWRCENCGFLFRNPRPGAKALQALYEEAFRGENIIAGTTGMAATTRGFAQRYVALLSRREQLSGARVLDFGAGLGAMAEALIQRGADVTALEPFAWRECEQAGIATYRQLDDLPDDSRFEGIVAIQVLEHLESPVTLLRRLRDLLTARGWLFLATPNACSLNARLSRERWREMAKPGHLVFFAPHTMDRLLADAGFARCERLGRFVRYTNSLPRAIMHLALQSVRLDGDLRYIAWRG